MNKLINNISLILSLFVFLAITSCSSDSNTTPTPTPATKTYKIQAKVGPIATITTATALGDTVAVELDPNGTDKLAARFVVLEGTTTKTTGVVFTTNTALPNTAQGVTVTNQSGVYLVTITPDAYRTTTDKTYTLSAKIETVTKTRTFKIKAKTDSSSTSLTVTGVHSVTTITTNGGTLQMSAMDGTTAVASPTWTVTETDGTATTKATITEAGVLTAVADGTVRVKVIAGSKEGTVDIVISNQQLSVIPVTSVTLARKSDQTATTAIAGSVPKDLAEVFDITVLPANATNKGVIWSIDPLNKNVATISDTGILSIISVGTVVIKVTAVGNPEKSSTGQNFVIAASTLAVAVTGLLLEKKGNKKTKVLVGGSVDLTEVFDITVSPTTATDKRVTWSIDPPQVAIATITDAGLLTGVSEGMINIKVTSVSQSSITSSLTEFSVITHKIQARVAANEFGLVLDTAKLGNDAPVEIDPSNADKLIVAFIMLAGVDAILEGVEYAISPALPTGAGSETVQGYFGVKLTPATYTTVEDTTYTVTATLAGTSTVTKTRQFKIKGKPAEVATLVVTGASSATTITTNVGTLQMSVVDDAGRAVTSPTWTVTEVDGSETSKATIATTGILTAAINGIVRVKASANDKVGYKNITISGQTVLGTTYKLEARIGSTILDVATADALADSTAVELDPNGTNKLVFGVILIEGSTRKSSGVNYVITPALPTGATSQILQGYFGVLLIPTNFTGTADVTYTITATLEGAASPAKTRTFKIKGKTGF